MRFGNKTDEGEDEDEDVIYAAAAAGECLSVTECLAGRKSPARLYVGSMYTPYQPCRRCGSGGWDFAYGSLKYRSPLLALRTHEIRKRRLQTCRLAVTAGVCGGEGSGGISWVRYIFRLTVVRSNVTS